MSDRRRLSKSELDLWRRATADVKPLAQVQADDDSAARVAKAKAPKPKPSPTVEKTAASAGKRPSRRPAARDHSGPVDIDRRSWTRLKRGQIPIERILDLHGRTQVEAHDALDRFLTMASAAGLRCVLVVTGKGGADGQGVLRSMVPRWLAEPDHRDKVLTYAPALPRHGGDGALYVLLRRRRARAAR